MTHMFLSSEKYGYRLEGRNRVASFLALRPPASAFDAQDFVHGRRALPASVSYTHLTLPTILLV